LTQVESVLYAVAVTEMIFTTKMLVADCTTDIHLRAAQVDG